MLELVGTSHRFNSPSRLRLGKTPKRSPSTGGREWRREVLDRSTDFAKETTKYQVALLVGVPTLLAASNLDFDPILAGFGLALLLVAVLLSLANIDRVVKVAVDPTTLDVHDVNPQMGYSYVALGLATLLFVGSVAVRQINPADDDGPDGPCTRTEQTVSGPEGTTETVTIECPVARPAEDQFGA